MRSARSGPVASAFMVVLALFGGDTVVARAPTDAHAVAAWTAVRGWVDAGRVPGTGNTTPPSVDGAAVQLHLGGRLLGGDAAHAAAGDADPLAKAARGALTNALADRFFVGLEPDERIAALSKLDVEVEVAGIPEPLIGPLDLLDIDIHPGLDGVAVRRNESWSVRFPSRLRSIGRAATLDTLHGMLLMEGVHEAEADTLRRTGEVAVYRVPTLTLRQSAHGRHPEGFERGRSGDFTPVSTPGQVRDIADRLAATLQDWHLRHAHDGSETAWFADVWDPNRDEWVALIAQDRDTALAALALARWAHTRPGGEHTRTALALARTALHTLSAKDDLSRSALALLWAAAAQAWPEGPPDDVLRPIHQPMVRESAGSGDLPTRAIATRALAARGQAQIVDASVSDWILRGPEAQLSTLPWSLEAVRTTGDERMDPHLELMRQLLLSRQLDAAGGRWGPEAAGAIALSRSGDTLGMPALRAAWAVAALSADAAPAERSMLRPRLLMLATHLRRRMIDLDEAGRFATPERAVDRIRLAPWDERLSMVAQSIGLLTALEIERALQETDS